MDHQVQQLSLEQKQKQHRGQVQYQRGILALIPEEKMTKTVNEILAIAEFLGDDMTTEQAVRLINEIMQLTSSDRAIVYEHIEGRIYNDMVKIEGSK